MCIIMINIYIYIMPLCVGWVGRYQFITAGSSDQRIRWLKVAGERGRRREEREERGER